MAVILIVEDDKKLNEGIRLALRSEECEILQSRSLGDAEEILGQRRIDLIILDLNLPDGNGLELLRKSRKASVTPVIILTANNMETDIVMGLEMGADDYITKPFSLAVLRARVNVQLRKAMADKDGQFEIDAFYFDFKKMKFTVDGEAIELSKTEQRLLRLLLDNRGNTLTRATIIDRVWSGDIEYVGEHALTVTIKRLRDKLKENPSDPVYIRTVYGIGYCWAVQ